MSKHYEDDRPSLKATLFHLLVTLGLIVLLGWAMIDLKERHEKAMGSPNKEIRLEP